MACKHCGDQDLKNALLPRELNLPEPFHSALAEYFDAENISKTQWGQVAQLKKDLVNIAVNMADGNKAEAAKILGISRNSIHEMIEKRYKPRKKKIEKTARE